MPYFIYTDLISSLLAPRLVDPGSTLIHVGAYDRKIGYELILELLICKILIYSDRKLSSAMLV